MTLKNAIASIFDVYGVKTVSKTDKAKQAYVLNKQQVKVLELAGIVPSVSKPAKSFEMHVLGDPKINFVKATYYHSIRKDPARTPEPRLGTDVINIWLNEGDNLLLATDGSNLYAVKLNNNSFYGTPDEIVETKIIDALPDDLVNKRAKSAPRKARKTKNTTVVYLRDPYIIESAKRRAKGACEMPQCKYKYFINENGKPYLEGHHVKPLSEGGSDSINNVAALCPTCHREQHYSKDKLYKRKILLTQLKNILKNKTKR